MSNSEENEENTREIILEPDSEYRFEVSFDNIIEITLIKGQAELFGCELCPSKKYQFCGCKYAIFSYQGAALSVKGNCLVEYSSNETSMQSYLNLHLGLERKREEASLQNEPGPNILILGTGRTTLSRILLNYSIRAGRNPLWVDLDITNGSLMFPGVIGALPLDRSIDVEGVPLTTPLTYFYGHSGGGSGLSGLSGSSSQASQTSSGSLNSSSHLPLENPKLYKLLISQLAQSVNSRLLSDDKAKLCGLLITSFGWYDHPLSLELLQLVLTAFQVNQLLIVGNERLHSDLTKKLGNVYPNLNVLKVPKSGGLVNKDASFRRLSAASKIRQYFYGGQNEYSPYPLVLSFNDLHIRRIGEGPIAPNSALPIGATRKVDETRIVRIELISPPPLSSSTKEIMAVPNTIYLNPNLLLNSILSLSDAHIEHEAKILDSNALGFVYISEVDETRKRVTVLSPCPGKLPRPYLLLGSIRWMEK